MHYRVLTCKRSEGLVIEVAPDAGGQALLAHQPTPEIEIVTASEGNAEACVRAPAQSEMPRGDLLLREPIQISTLLRQRCVAGMLCFFTPPLQASWLSMGSNNFAVSWSS